MSGVFGPSTLGATASSLRLLQDGRPARLHLGSERHPKLPRPLTWRSPSPHPLPSLAGHRARNPSPAIFLGRPIGPSLTLPSDSWDVRESCIRERNRSDEGSSFRQ